MPVSSDGKTRWVWPPRQPSPAIQPLHQVQSNAKNGLKPFRGYLSSDEAFNIENFTTRFVTIADGDGLYYDLQGRRIQTVPQHPGIYISNGAKVIVR
jgi:hypothetical protein